MLNKDLTFPTDKGEVCLARMDLTRKAENHFHLETKTIINEFAKKDTFERKGLQKEIMGFYDISSF